MAPELTLYKAYLLWMYQSSIVYNPQKTFIAEPSDVSSILAPSFVANLLAMYLTYRTHPGTPTVYSGCAMLI